MTKTEDDRANRRTRHAAIRAEVAAEAAENATTLDEAGLSARHIADQLGHSRPSMTQDVYLGRKAGSGGAADALERAIDN
ncbi:hypothetical protein [Actinopolyspora saharensis]|uniref:hypothetical protein n=1 Tax=Actinopolyspora saharensis TaxID=995062 RepID=UPI003F66B9BA